MRGRRLNRPGRQRFGSQVALCHRSPARGHEGTGGALRPSLHQGPRRKERGGTSAEGVPEDEGEARTWGSRP